MVFVSIGYIESIKDNEFVIKDADSSDRIKMIWKGKDSLESSLGQHAIIYGDVRQGAFHAHRLDIRKFLIPHSERELTDNVITALLELQDNPFEELYKKLQEN